ncbi:MAG: GAF domain-containing sensor histidine kinase [Anaerolineae bacterium]|nr:GAF domain-containing sensor histidine kinase [Anaerolineae bacterium]
MTAPPGYVSIDSYRQLMARYERLMELSRQLNSTLDLGALLNRITNAAAELTNTEEASILLLDSASGELRFEAASNMSGSAMAAIPVPIDGSLAGWVVSHSEPALVQDVHNDPRWYASVDKTTLFSTRNLLAVPMKIHNRVIGVVEAINKLGDKNWTEDDVNTLTALANQAAIAVHNAQLFQQSDFIAEMVHELRTPLAALKASTSLLLRPTFPDEQRTEVMLTMQQETERLTKMTTDFLDLARLESGRTRLRPKGFSLRALVAECIDLIRPQAAERDIQIILQAEEVDTEADRDKVKQVILNLLTNAVKYNRDNGTITCTVRVLPADETGPPCRVLVSVRDTGYGISEEDQQHVFDKFFRVASTAHDTAGTGLGLSIARRIVEAHGCEMDLESEHGEGTTFYFGLPLAEKRATPGIPPGSAELIPSGHDQ